MRLLLSGLLLIVSQAVWSAAPAEKDVTEQRADDFVAEQEAYLAEKQAERDAQVEKSRARVKKVASVAVFVAGLLILLRAWLHRRVGRFIEEKLDEPE